MKKIHQAPRPKACKTWSWHGTERAKNKNESITKSVGLSVCLVAMGVGLRKACKTKRLSQENTSLQIPCYAMFKIWTFDRRPKRTLGRLDAFTWKMQVYKPYAMLCSRYGVSAAGVREP